MRLPVVPAEESNGFSYGPPPTPEQVAREYDVCIVGSGAAGSIAALELVNAGFRVLVLEQGPFVDRRASYDEILRSSEPAYGRMPNGCWGLVGYPWTTCNVGGGTVFYGGVAFRYREVDFDASDHLPDADLPVRWPYDYAELAPFYDEVEGLLEIAADPAGDPTSPPVARSEYLPPVARSASGKILWNAAETLGWRPFPTPMAIRTVETEAGAACDLETPCIENPCKTGAKRDASTVLLPLLDRPNLDLIAGMKVVELRRRSRERVSEVLAVRVDTRETYQLRARWFLVAANAIQSAALLLRSRDSWSPDGLGNEHDMVGRGLCFKLDAYVSGFRNGGHEPGASGPSPVKGGPFSTMTVLDHYVDDTCPTGLGGLIYEARHGFRYSMRDVDGGALRVQCLLSDQPSRENRVHLAREARSLRSAVPGDRLPDPSAGCRAAGTHDRTVRGSAAGRRLPVAPTGGDRLPPGELPPPRHLPRQ